jgi:hypothetical protein
VRSRTREVDPRSSSRIYRTEAKLRAPLEGFKTRTRSRVLNQNPLEGFKLEPALDRRYASFGRELIWRARIERTQTRTRASVRLDVRQGRMLFYLQIDDVCLRA